MWKRRKAPVFKVLAVPAEDGLNQPLLLEGRMPEKDNECVIEMPDTTGPHTGRNAYSIGSTIKVSSESGDKKLEDTLSQNAYTVVGYIRSPQYISIERGATSVGSGDISFYMMVKPGFLSQSATPTPMFIRLPARTGSQPTALSTRTQSQIWKNVWRVWGTNAFRSTTTIS